MRIRKRQVPLPLSSLPPIPISSSLAAADPQFNGSSPVVQLHKHGLDPHHSLSRQAVASCSRPSDHPHQPIGTGNSNATLDHLNLEDEKGEEGNGSSSNRMNSSTLGEEIAAAGVLSQLSCSSLQVVGRWCERDKAFPWKKRIRKESSDNDDEDKEEDRKDYKKKEKKMRSSTQMKMKMSKKLDQDHEGILDRKTSSSKGSGNTNKRSSSSPTGRGSGAIMEGSRCSRVNGRGWRCCQQTLVGYSLCEHHLGKGRLRSMNNVRSQSHNLGSSTKTTAPASTAAADQNHHDANKQLALKSEAKQELINGESVDGDDDGKPLVIGNKKRMKLGMVKARSLSSLLGQKDNDHQINVDSKSSSDHHNMHNNM